MADSSTFFPDVSSSAGKDMAHLVLLDADGCTCHEAVKVVSDSSQVAERARQELLRGPLKSKTKNVTVASGSNRLTYSSDLSHGLGIGRSKATLRLSLLLQVMASHVDYHAELSYLGNLDSTCLAVSDSLDLFNMPRGDFGEIVLENDKFALVLFQVWLMHHKLGSDNFTVTFLDDRLDLVESVQKQLPFVHGVHYVKGEEKAHFLSETPYVDSIWSKYAIKHFSGVDARPQIQNLMAMYNQKITNSLSAKHYNPLEAFVSPRSLYQQFSKSLEKCMPPAYIQANLLSIPKPSMKQQKALLNPVPAGGFAARYRKKRNSSQGDNPKRESNEVKTSLATNGVGVPVLASPSHQGGASISTFSAFSSVRSDAFSGSRGLLAFGSGPVPVPASAGNDAKSLLVPVAESPMKSNSSDVAAGPTSLSNA